MMTSKTVKKQLLASKVSIVRSLNNEKTLKWELTRFFQTLKEQVLKELEHYYNEEFMFQAHADMILSPIFESQKEYYSILEKYNKKEFQFGVNEAKRLTRLARQKVRKQNRKYYASLKSETPHINPEKLIHTKIDKDELFATNPWTEQELLRKSFTASENTMNRVDENINKILSEGYRGGKGIKEVRNDIIRRFDQLKDWEANRIARTEIHNAHQQGVMNTYHDLGVDYTQWSAAQDDRTRDSHADLDGEIIPLGGKFSNGLGYPGDTTGPIEEWINCR